MSSAHILVIDDEQSMCEWLAANLDKLGYRVTWKTTDTAAQAVLLQDDVDVLVTDLKLAETSGLNLCEWVVTNRPDVPVIIITAFGSMQAAVASLRVGAYDFITKPIDIEALDFSLRRAINHRQLGVEVKRLREAVENIQRLDELVGNSPPMRKVFDLITRVGATDAAVLILGESGTGKELVARALHACSERKDGPFVAVNCSAMPATLLESELFGHRRGAFTDAKQSRDGLFIQANHGTLFLDEIGEMPLEMQPKLLRALQENVVRPLGGTGDIPFDARVITSTNRDLESDVEAGVFREDLFYRINVVQFVLPSLRARGNDILLLAQYFLERAAKRLRREVHGLSGAAGQKLMAYDWPGNVRELQNCIERAVTLTRFDQLTVDDLPEKIQKHQATQLVLTGADPDQMLSLQELEKRYIARVLQSVGDNKTQAARILGLDRRTLYRKLGRYDE